MESKSSLLLKELKGRSKTAKALLGLLCLLLFFAVCLFFGAVSVSLDCLFHRGGSVTPKLSLLSFLRAGFLEPKNLLLSLGCFIVLSVALSVKFLRSYEPNPVSASDERGVSFLETSPTPTRCSTSPVPY